MLVNRRQPFTPDADESAQSPCCSAATMPIVSVCCPTYNHELFIAQAIDGFLMQRTDFPFEIIVHDDASTDRTRDIVRDYQSRYPQRIRIVQQEQNQKSRGKKALPILISLARGQYIAVCEGDDYWTDPHKLQKQVNFLEANPEYSLCFHDAFIEKFSSGEQWDPRGAHPLRTTYGLEDISRGNFIYTTSVLFRRSALTLFPPPWYDRLPMGDWPLWILCAKQGAIGHLNDCMAVYRLHERGVWSSKSDLQQVEESLRAARVIGRNLNLSESGRAVVRDWLSRLTLRSLRNEFQSHVKILCLGTSLDWLLPFRCMGEGVRRRRRLIRKLLGKFGGQVGSKMPPLISGAPRPKGSDQTVKADSGT